MSQITTPRELKAAFAYQFARPIDRWAFSFARGWLPIIVRTCEAIDALVRENRYRHRFHWLQIKEKFGTLRLYWEARGMRAIRVDLVTPTGVQSVLPVPVDDSPDGLVATRIRQIVRAAEEESARTCMACGAAGSLRDGDWMLTLCDVHALQSEQDKHLDMWFPNESPDAGQP